ncbi:hypothetical protein DFH29DRAFT_110490 [Suillus ampliporus]|nr:hypothetical protein DFH29DRAFT_110490 [Suillus ampliporus]
MVFLFGIVILQTYYCFKRYPNDRPWLKSLVVWIWMEEIGHTISVLSGLYLTVTEFGQHDALAVTTIRLATHGQSYLMAQSDLSWRSSLRTVCTCCRNSCTSQSSPRVLHHSDWWGA